MKKVLVLGCGFAGLQTAIGLQKKGGFEITLVSDRDYLYLFPISIWIPVHMKEFEDVKVPLTKIRKKYPFKLILDKVTEIHARYGNIRMFLQSAMSPLLKVLNGLQNKGILRNSWGVMLPITSFKWKREAANEKATRNI